MLDNDTFKNIIQEKGFLQVSWILFFSFFLAIVKVFYLEITKKYDVIRSGVLSVSAGVMAGLISWHLDFPFLLILIIVSLTSFAGQMFWDGVTKEFPRVFRTILESYMRKGK